MNNSNKLYDLVVIGAGSGGVRAARISASYGAKVAVIEEDRPGGTCVLRGCIPKNSWFMHLNLTNKCLMQKNMVGK